jgi:hypothetical protein
MVGELEIIFGLHAIAVERRVVSQLAILFEHLRGIAAGPAVDPVALAAAARAATIVATAAPAIVVTILVQRKSVSSTIDRPLGRVSPSTGAIPKPGNFAAWFPICTFGGR